MCDIYSGAGQKLALAELVTAVVHVLLNFQIYLPPGPPPSLTPGGLLSPHDLRLILRNVPSAA